eukprot:sb/3478489/
MCGSTLCHPTPLKIIIPRYTLALENVSPTDTSYVKSCSIDTGFNHGIGVLGSHNVDIEDNVIYHNMGSGIITNSEKTKIVDNVGLHVALWQLTLSPPPLD